MSVTEALAKDKLFGATEGIDLILSAAGNPSGQRLDAIVAPTDNPAWPTDLINGDHFSIGSSSPAGGPGGPPLLQRRGVVWFGGPRTFAYVAPPQAHTLQPCV